MGDGVAGGAESGDLLLHLPLEVMFLDDTGYQADTQGFLGCHRRAGQHHLQGAPGADQARQPEAGAPVGNQAELDPGGGQRGVGGGESQVAGQCERQPGAGGNAVDRRHRQSGKRLQRQHDLVADAQQLAKAGLITAALQAHHMVDVGAGAERPALAGHDDRTDAIVGRRGLDVLEELFAHVAGQGVELLGSVQRDPRHQVADFVLDLGFAHSSFAVPVAVTGGGGSARWSVPPSATFHQQ